MKVLVQCEAEKLAADELDKLQQYPDSDERQKQSNEAPLLPLEVLHQSREYAHCITCALSAAHIWMLMEKRSGVELNMEPQEGGGLKELVLRWFTETQAPLVQHNGNFPAWFQGLATRK